MATNVSLEERLAALETAIAELQEHIAISPQSTWLGQITGAFKDEPAFEEILTYGHAIRKGNESLLPTENE